MGFSVTPSSEQSLPPTSSVCGMPDQNGIARLDSYSTLNCRLARPRGTVSDFEPRHPALAVAYPNALDERLLSLRFSNRL